MTPDRPRPRSARISPDLLAFLGFFALTAAFYAPLLLGLRSFPPGDFTDHFLPFSLFQRAELLAGRLPLWNPYTFSGHPFLADVQAAVFYPLSNLVLALTLPWSDPAARLYWLQIEAAIHVALAGCFTYLLARELTRNRLAAFLAGCVFAFSGYLTGYPPLQLAVLRTAIWLPLILWLLRRAFDCDENRTRMNADTCTALRLVQCRCERGEENPSALVRARHAPGGVDGCPRPLSGHFERWRWWVAASLAYTTAFLAGHSQTFLFLSYAVAGWILFLFIAAGGNRARTLWRVAAFYAIFLALGAAQLLPSLEFAGLSVRANVDYAFVSGGFPLRDTWQMLLPGVVSTFSPLYVGLIPLGLALVGGVFGARRTKDERRKTKDQGAERPAARDRGTVLFFVALAVLALLVSFGNHGFLYPVLYRWAPGWALFRGQERAAYLVAFGLSILAGYGAAALGGLTARQRRTAGVVYAAVVAAGLIGAALVLRPAADSATSQAALVRGLVAGLIALGGWVLILWLDFAERRRLWLLIALTVVGLFIVNFAVNLTPTRAYPQAVAAAMKADAVQAAALAADGNVPGRVHNEDVLFEDYGMLVGVEDVSGSSPLRLARYQALLDGFPRERLWRLAGVKTVVSSRPDLYAPVESRVALPDGNKPGYLYRLAGANPRAWVVNSLLTIDDAHALPLMGDARFDPEQTALIPPPAPSGLEEGVLAPAGANRVRLERLAPNRLRAHVQSEHGGLLMVSENWMPGWRATVQGTGGQARREVPVVRADLTFLGVPVRPGESTIELIYWPDSVRVGLAISGVALLLLVAAIGWRVLRIRGQGSGIRGQGSGIRNQESGVRQQESGGGSWSFVPRPSSFGRPSSVVRRHRLVMLLVLLSAFALRVFRLGYQELRGDEALGRLFTLEPFGKIIASTISLREPHPVASYFIEKTWLGLAGHSEFALRFASLWFGVLAVALLYRLGRRLGLGWAASTLAAALLALSPYAIWHSQDARMYSMSLALTTASTLLMLEALARRRLIFWLGYIGVTWLALHTHYYAAYVIVAQNVFVIGRAIWARAERRNLLSWLAAQAVTGLLYLPWLLMARATLTGYGGNGDSPAFLSMWVRSLSVFAAGESVPGDQRPVLALLAALLVLIGAARLALAGPTGRRTLWLLTLYLGLPLLVTWLGALSRPIFNERYLVAALPAFFLLIAAAVSVPQEVRDAEAGGGETRWRAALKYVTGALLIILVVGASLSLVRHYDDPTYSKTHGWRNLATVLERHSAAWPSDKARVVQTFPDPTLWYYYTGPAERLVLPPAANSAEGAAREVAALAAKDVQRVVIAAQENPIWDAQGVASTSVAQGGYELLSETPVGNWQVQVFGRPPRSLPPVDVEFVNPLGAAGVRMIGAAVPVERLIPGDVLPVYLRWAGDASALSGAEKLTLQLLDADGKLVAQTDRPFGAAQLDEQPSGASITLPRFLSPGAYRLIAALYDPSKPGAPRWRTSAGADYVELAVLSAAEETGLR